MAYRNTLRQARQTAGLTQTQLARVTDGYQSDISKWERGDGLPTVPQLQALATALELTTDQLLGSATVSATRPAARHTDPRLARINRDFPGLSTEAQDHISKQVALLAKLERRISRRAGAAAGRTDTPVPAIQPTGHRNRPAAASGGAGGRKTRP